MIVVDGLDVLARNPLGGDDPFGRRHVGELWMRRATCAERDDVANSREPWNTCAEQIVDGNIAAIGVEAERFHTDTLSDRTAPRGDEQIIGAHFFDLAVRQLRLDLDARGTGRRFRHFGTRVDRRCPAS